MNRMEISASLASTVKRDQRETATGGTGADANLDFLTGALNTYQQSKAQQNALRAPIPSLYIQDTYRATKRLVLSAGLRWDPEYVPVDNFYRGSIFDYGVFPQQHA